MRIGNWISTATFACLIGFGVSHAQAAKPSLTTTLTITARGVYKDAGGTTTHKLTQEEFKQAEPKAQAALDKLVDRGVIGRGEPMIPVPKPDLSAEEEISSDQFALYFRSLAYEEDQLIQIEQDKRMTRQQAIQLRNDEIRQREEALRAMMIRNEADRQAAIAAQERERDRDRDRDRNRDPDPRPNVTTINTNTPVKSSTAEPKANPPITNTAKINLAPATTTGKPVAGAGQVQLTTPPVNNGNNNTSKSPSQANSNSGGTSRVAVAPTSRPSPPAPDRTPSKSSPSDNKSNSAPSSKDATKDDKTKTNTRK